MSETADSAFASASLHNGFDRAPLSPEAPVVILQAPSPACLLMPVTQVTQIIRMPMPLLGTEGIPLF
jgi:hypothetical protein